MSYLAVTYGIYEQLEQHTGGMKASNKPQFIGLSGPVDTGTPARAAHVR